MPEIRDAVIVAARRSAVGRAQKGTLRNTRPDDLAAQVIAGALAELPGLPLDLIDDVALGCAMPEAEQGLNVARVVALRAGLPDSSSAITLNRFCASGLQAIATIAERVMVGAIDCGIGGGLESMSLIPMGGHKALFDPAVVASARSSTSPWASPPRTSPSASRSAAPIKTPSPSSRTSGRSPRSPRANSRARSCPCAPPRAAPSPSTRARAPTPPSRASPSCAPSSTRAAASPPATPRR
jgi:hypothetical protein